MMDIYNFNPYNFKPYKAVKKYNLSKGERKRCKSCKYFDKHLTASSCTLGKRRYTAPNDIACANYEKRKR